jgi:hypothetical protein
VDGIVFHEPVFVGNEVSLYARLFAGGPHLDDDSRPGLAAPFD